MEGITRVMTTDRSITLFIDPFTHHFEQDALFDVKTEKQNGDNILAPYVYLRDWFAARGIAVHTADQLLSHNVRSSAQNIYVSFGLRNRYLKMAQQPNVTLSAFFAFESPVVEPKMYSGLPKVQRYFKRLFSFTDGESLSRFLPRPIQFQQFCLPFPFDTVREDIWSRTDRKFLVMINHNKLPAVYWNELYTERMRAIDFFGRTGEFDLYGKGWNGPSFQMGIGWVPGTVQRIHRSLLTQWQRFRPDPLLVSARRVYKGALWHKLETLSEYKFSLCFDNVILKGWVTEKIFDCFVAGTVPVYWGAPDIENYVPKNCFIDMRDFANYDELLRFLKSLPESKVCEYRQNAKDYMKSPLFRRFTKKAFTEILARIVEEDTGVKLLDDKLPTLDNVRDSARVVGLTAAG